MNRNKTSLIALAFAGVSIWVVVAARAQDGQALHDKPTTACAIGDRLNNLVAEIRAEKKLVGLGATIMIDGKRLHTPRLNRYAFGWVVPDQNKWTNGRLIWHNGSNTMWYALLAILPERNAVVSVTSNDGDIKSAEEAAFQIVGEFSKMK